MVEKVLPLTYNVSYLVMSKKLLFVILIAALLFAGCMQPAEETHTPSPTGKSSVTETLTPITEPSPAVEPYSGPWPPVIDAHVHLMPEPSSEQMAYIDELVAEMDRLGVVKATLEGLAEKRTPRDDRHILAAYSRFPNRFYPYLSGFDPQDEAAVDYVKQQLETGKWQGIGEIYLRHSDAHTMVPADHLVMLQIYDLAAEHNVPIHIHFEPDYGTDYESGIQEIKRALAHNPDTTFIWAHSAHGNIHLMKEFPNLYVEARLRDVTQLSDVFVDRIMYGSDVCYRGPELCGGGSYTEEIERLRRELSLLDAEVAERVAYKTAARLMKDETLIQQLDLQRDSIPTPTPTTPPSSLGTVGHTKITDVTWNPDTHTIHIKFDSWPGVWGGWRVYIDGVEIPMEGGVGEPVVRPDAPLDQPPTGVIVGTLPWVTGLDHVDFPRCGTIQFYIPGQGLTNLYHYNLVDFGSVTASKKECPSEWVVHEGNLVIEGQETRLIENEKFFQKGNVYVRDRATLIIRNTEFMMSRGAVPTVHVYFFVDPHAKLIIENSQIHPPVAGGTEPGLICVINHGEVRMSDSPTAIHYFDMSEGAKFVMVNSEMVNPIGGLLQVNGGETQVVDSTLGALGLSVAADAHLEVSGLHSGVYYESWDVHQMIPQANYSLVLERTTILKDELSGKLKHGPYERGWIFFLDSNAHVRISDSELRKVFIDIRNDTAEFHDLRAGIPSSLTYRDIILDNVIIMGQWPFTITDSNVTITNSDYLFLQPSGSSKVKLIDSHMIEFIPREFFGTMTFENGLWTEAGEVIGGVPYHSMSNDFVIKGSLRIEGVQENLQWKDARVTRVFDVIVKDSQGKPVSGVMVKVAGEAHLTDDTGRTTFNIIFNEANYNRPTTLEVWRQMRLITQQEINFFTETPIIVTIPT
jgi:predicted TIM-barrel fold metal-dependent hydrolase